MLFGKSFLSMLLSMGGRTRARTRTRTELKLWTLAWTPTTQTFEHACPPISTTAYSTTDIEVFQTSDGGYAHT